MTYRVCFVCTGNICRSPMAASVFRARVEEAGLDGLVEVDSAGTGGWHEGDPADPRTVSVLEEHGYDAGEDLDVPDPYYGDRDGFEECLTMVESASTGLLTAVREEVEGRTP